MSRILIAEDEPRLSSFLEKGLRAAGHTTTVCAGRRARPRRWRVDDDFDLLILDIGLPGQDGFAVLRALRARGSQLPVLVLTARDEIADTVTGLDLGADDYVTKPFVFEELLARVRARLRATGGDGGEAMTLDVGGDPPRRAHAPRRGGRRGRRPDRARSSRCSRRSCATPARCSAASSCSRTCGATTTTRARTSSTSTSATCAAKLGQERFETVRGMGYAALNPQARGRALREGRRSPRGSRFCAPVRRASGSGASAPRSRSASRYARSSRRIAAARAPSIAPAVAGDDVRRLLDERLEPRRASRGRRSASRRRRSSGSRPARGSRRRRARSPTGPRPPSRRRCGPRPRAARAPARRGRSGPGTGSTCGPGSASGPGRSM